MPPSRSKADKELQAMGKIIGALEGLEGESINRVLDYVLGRLSVGRSTRATSLSQPIVTAAGGDAVKARQMSIRDLKEEKQPESLNQMAALVAYYLSEMAPENERREEISSVDLERYFKQAGFKLPKSLRQALPNAAAAGYFDGAGGGRYRLNPVGYNLIVHALPRGSDTKNKRARPKKASKKKKARR
jgi:hypothetical protein